MLRGSRQKWMGVFFAIALVVITYFMAHSIWTEWSEIRSYQWQIHLGWLILAAAILWSVSIILVLLWRYLITQISDCRLGFVSLFRIAALANLGKYLPGKIWSVLGMIYLLRQEGLSSSVAIVSASLHQVFTLLSGIIFILVILGTEVLHDTLVFPFIIVGGIGAIVLYPPLFRRGLNMLMRFLGREPLVVNLTMFQNLFLLSIYIVPWVLYGSSFWCLLKGIGISGGEFLETGAKFSAAYLLGFLAIFAPGGIGVREGTLMFLFSATMPPGIAAIIAVVARLWMTLIEVTQILPFLKSLKKLVR